MCDDGFPCFEISAINADKPPLSIAEIKRRVEQFRKAGMNMTNCYSAKYYSHTWIFFRTIYHVACPLFCYIPSALIQLLCQSNECALV